VLVGDLLFPDGNGIWTAFPSGSGTLATITFQAIKQGSDPLSCALALRNTLIVNDDLGDVLHNINDGQYTISASP
jgi:hypothetical protein